MTTSRPVLAKISVILSVFLLFTAGVNFARGQMTGDEHSVYSDLFERLSRNENNRNFVIRNRTEPVLIQDAVLFKKFGKGIVDNFNSQNSTSSIIENNFGDKQNVSVVGDEVNDILKPLERDFGKKEQTNWAEFRRKYNTEAILSVSRVGFDKAKLRALLLLGSSSGWTGGDGFYYLMKRENGHWRVKMKVRAWIS